MNISCVQKEKEKQTNKQTNKQTGKKSFTIPSRSKPLMWFIITGNSSYKQRLFRTREDKMNYNLYAVTEEE